MSSVSFASSDPRKKQNRKDEVRFGAFFLRDFINTLLLLRVFLGTPDTCLSCLVSAFFCHDHHGLAHCRS